MLCHIALCSYFYYDHLESDDSSYSPEGKSVLIYGLICFYHFQYVTIFLIMIYNFLKRKNIEKFLKLLEKFDDHSEIMGWKYKINHERNYWSSIFWIFISLISLVVVYALQMYWITPVEHRFSEFIGMIFYCSMTNTFVLSSLQFVFGVQSVASRFEILNQNTR